MKKDQEKQILKPVNVRALRTGFYMYQRRRAGEVFVMDEADVYQRDIKGEIKKLGDEPLVCSWIELVESAKPDVNEEAMQGRRRARGA